MAIQIAEVSLEQAQIILNVQEGHFNDVKALEISPAKITNTISAFANTSGGEIYVGVEEIYGAEGYIRAWRGFEDTEAANGLIQAIEALSPLGNHYSFVLLQCDTLHGLVGHITVYKTKEILNASSGKAYVRRGAQNLPVIGDEALQRLKYDKGLVSFEDEIVADLPLKEISNSSAIIEFMLNVVPTAEPEQWLEKQRISVGERPTVAGTLLFNDEPQAILPKRSAVKIFQYKTKAEGERDTLAFDPITIEGPIYDLIYTAVENCKEIVESVQKLKPEGLERVSYPQEALHEIITNAVLHRDYSIAADVQVRVFDNRIEIESPGRFPGHVTEENVLREQFARNPKIVRLINKFPEPPNKDVGEGLNTAFEAMEKLRLKAPIIQENENSVLVVLKHESLGSPEQLVMKYLETHESITNSTARDITGIKSENTMKRVFYRLRDSNLLEQTADNRAVWKKKTLI